MDLEVLNLAKDRDNFKNASSATLHFTLLHNKHLNLFNQYTSNKAFYWQLWTLDIYHLLKIDHRIL